MNKKLVVLAIFSIMVLAPTQAAAFSAEPAYRYKGQPAPWTNGPLISELQLHSEVVYQLKVNNETIVGNVLPIHPHNKKIVFVSTVRYPSPGLAVYSVYTYSLTRHTLWKYFEVKIPNTDKNALGLEPVGIDGQNLILRRVTTPAATYACDPTLNWYLYSYRYDLLALNINPLIKSKQLNYFGLPTELANNGLNDKNACNEISNSAVNYNSSNHPGNLGNSNNIFVDLNSAKIPELAGCELYPYDNPWNQNISASNLRAESASFVSTIGNDKYLQVGFGSDSGNGIPYNVIGPGATWYPITYGTGAKYSNPGPYPVPQTPLIEAKSPRRMIVLDSNSCYFYETVNPSPDPTSGRWLVDLGAVFYLKANYLRPPKWPSATASGLPLLPGLVKYNEVASGEIKHALIFTAPQIQKSFIAPATAGGTLDDGRYPAFGARFRLRQDYDTSRLPTQAKVIADALKKYGMFLGDYGNAWTILGTPDTRWNDQELRALNRIPGVMFESVDTGGYVQLWE